MKREQFIARLSRTARRLYGLRVTDQMLGDWLREGLIVAPEKRGRVREWSACHYRVALKICRFRRYGARRAAEVRWLLWLTGSPPEKFEPENHRDDLVKAFTRIRILLLKDIHSTFHPGVHTDRTGGRTRALVAGLGQLDPTLEALFPYSPEKLSMLYGLIRFLGDEEKPEDVVKSAALALLGVITEHLPVLQKVTVPERGFDCLINIMRGFLDDLVEEGTGTDSIQNASPTSFDAAHKLHNLTPIFLLKLGLTSAARSLQQHSAWRIGIYVFCLHILHRAKAVPGLNWLKAA
jgi:hypothetical protein